MAKVFTQLGSREEPAAPPRGASGDERTTTPAGNIIERSSLSREEPEIAAAQETGALPVTDSRERRIAMAAYYRAECRGFAPGADVNDWLGAERELDEKAGADGIG